MIDFDINTAIETAIARKTDVERAEEQRLQAEGAAKLSLPTPLQIRQQLGARMARAAAKELQAQPSDDACNRLAEGLALQGHYHEAVKVAQDQRLRDIYQRVIDATNNTEVCGCPKRQNGQETTFLQDTIVFEDKVVQVYKCTICKTLRC